MARYRVSRGDDLVLEDVDEQGLGRWQESLERLVTTGALVRPGRFAIAELVDGELGRIANWRPQPRFNAIQRGGR